MSLAFVLDSGRLLLLAVVILPLNARAQVLPEQCSVNIGHHLIACSNRSLTSMLESYPKEFGDDHTGLHISIAFDHNQLSALTEFPATSSSISFSCRHCQMVSVAPNVFANVFTVTHLDLSHNNLTQYSFADDAFHDARIEQLFLAHNQIETLQPDLLTAQALRRLDLSHNRFKTIQHIVTAVHFTTLDHLDLSANQLTDFAASLMDGNSPKLQTLHLQDNALTTIPGGVTALRSSIKYLDISGNLIANLTAQSFSGLDKLETLVLGRSSHLETIDEDAFAPLTSVKSMYLQDNLQLTSLNLSGLLAATGLEVLDLTNCSLRELFVIRTNHSLFVFPHLRDLRLRDNPWHCDCELYSTITRLLNVSLAFDRLRSDYTARCHSPDALATDFVADMLTDREYCTQPHHWAPRPVDSPYYMRPRLIFMTVGVVLCVVLIGLLVGLFIVCVQTRLRANTASIDSPVRYTTVRNSQQPTTIHADEMYTL